MKTKIFNAEGKKGKEITLPGFFSMPVREDIVSHVLEAKKAIQPYSPSPVAGKQHSASGKMVHRRHVWRSGYGRGMARVPRKIFTRRGSQFIWAGAEVASTRGGRRAHPPKTIPMINTMKINKKTNKAALVSGLSATASRKHIASRYKTLTESDVKEVPIIVESAITKLKTKYLLAAFKKILGENLFNLAVRKKSVRAGKGKARGRRYKSNAGMILVTGSNEDLKTNAFQVKSAKNLGIKDLASGGLGRLTVYTESAIKELNERIEKSRAPDAQK